MVLEAERLKAMTTFRKSADAAARKEHTMPTTEAPTRPSTMEQSIITIIAVTMITVVIHLLKIK